MNSIEKFFEDCKRNNVQPSNVVALLPNGHAIVRATIRVECSNGIVQPDDEPGTGMESAELTPEYYAMVTGGSTNRKEVLELMKAEEEKELGVCANCPHIGQCSEPVPVDCPIND